MSPYGKCKVDPDSSDFVKNFEDLHPDFKEDLYLEKTSRNSVFRYIVLMYDTESPYVIKYKDITTRRMQAARNCNFPRSGVEYQSEVERLVLGKNSRVNKMALRYMFLQSDIDFLQYQSYQIMYYKQLKNTIDGDYDDPSKYTKLKANLDSLSGELKKLQTAIFHGDESKDMKKALYDFASKINLDFRPEHRASRVEKGKDAVDESPYPKDYEVEKLTFNNDE
ncbi:MAG: hypothetical protein JXR54_09930 [Tannerellaceae bacterium]|nr:hypothetical protein [Tannerellaceae bacterium]